MGTLRPQRENGLGWQSPVSRILAQALAQLLPKQAGGREPIHPPGAGWQLVFCPQSDPAPPAPCALPWSAQLWMDRRLGSDSPRHIPGPATIFFFFFFW